MNTTDTVQVPAADSPLPESGAALMDEIANYWRPYVHAATPNAVELMCLWAGHTWLLNIPDPEGPEREALRLWRTEYRKRAAARVKESEIIAQIGPEPLIPDDPRMDKVKAPLGLFTSPILAINAEGPGLGKSKAMQALRGLGFSSMPIQYATTVAAMREFLAAGGTFLVDEAHRVFRYDHPQRSEVEALINASFDLEGGGISKMVQKKSGEHELQTSQVFAPWAVAGINMHMPADVESRMIWVNMTRGDVARWDDRTTPTPFHSYGIRLRELLRPQLALAFEHDAAMPPELTGRLGDKWRPLIITADLIGGRWPQVARELAVDAINDERDEQDEVPEQALLYRDCLAVFEPEEDRLTGAVLIERLRPLQDGGLWGDRSGRPLNTTHDLARRLNSRSFHPARPKSNGSNRAYPAAAFHAGLEHYREVLLTSLSEVSEVSESAPTLGLGPDTLPRP
ncbi:DUF3631 domain-containing protein [Galactobacter caseinivorans]|uniref:DUF3631 domain-containing protein n=1 Tax=Galactobacter caseinivorans TaxID=2676123 RepID=A0A496PHA4_9MICC|nr:DUF3631 domain-containing protein [Galactobacter caseinivorans]RKW69862.1 DUF3631 domain-containing protein [Galactobacter caseinivorans]